MGHQCQLRALQTALSIEQQMHIMNSLNILSVPVFYNDALAKMKIYFVQVMYYVFQKCTASEMLKTVSFYCL